MPYGRTGTVRKRSRRKWGYWRSSRLRFILVLGICAAATAGFFLSNSPQAGPQIRRVALIDQLSATYSDLDFVENVITTTRQAGYELDYYPFDRIGVDLYRRLPTFGYSLILLRVHSPEVDSVDANGNASDEVALMTAEIYDPINDIHKEEAHYLTIPSARAREIYQGRPLLGVTADFVREKMQGNFGGATIILMGCSGLKSDILAKAFIVRGAKNVIAWDDNVSGIHTDAAAEALVNHMLIDKLPIGQAVGKAMDELGPDPLYGARLALYPRASQAAN